MAGIWKMTVRSIRSHIARYLALFCIVALSAGFFAGLKIARDAMVHTGENYLKAQNFYDFQLLSTIGFTPESLEETPLPEGISAAEGGIALDVLAPHEDALQVFKLYSLPKQLNVPTLVEGRMPQASDECLADARNFRSEDIGQTVTLSKSTPEQTLAQLAHNSFTVVGTVDSPLHIGVDRGQSKLGGGSVFSYFYLPEEAFLTEQYTQISLTMQEDAHLYSERYRQAVENMQASAEALCQTLAQRSYTELLSSVDITQDGLAQLPSPQCYVLTREDNLGYVNFENDTQIIHSVAGLFPIFFILIAILVCVTTMTRMVDEERTQIGVLKALGFSDAQIVGKYLLYAATATVLGWFFGFFLFTWLLPLVFWSAYQVLYQFAPIDYLFSPSLAAITLSFSLLCILGSTYLSCRRELRSVAAELIRPRVARTGKRIVLERIRPFWKRLSFLQKITLRNMFRYKQRLAMMLVGIGACAGLLLTGFGLRDSMFTIADEQYGNVQRYDVQAYYSEGAENVVEKEISSFASSVHVRLEAAEIEGEEKILRSLLLRYDSASDFSDYWHFEADGETINLPQKGQALINFQTAKRLNLKKGDLLTFANTERVMGSVEISGIFDSYIQNYIVVSEETYADLFGTEENNCVLLKGSGNAEALAKKAVELDAVTSVSNLGDMRRNANEVLSALNIIIGLVVGFSAALSFIVIFNLTNINLAERSREIATVQVLGFYKRETESYALRENLILSVLASILGLPFGIVLHSAVMDMVDIDLFSFRTQISTLSYVYAFVLSVAFAALVNLLMARRINKINMAESLKAVE